MHEAEDVVQDAGSDGGEHAIHRVTRRVVPGGWLYTTTVAAQNSEGRPTLAVATTFVPAHTVVSS